MDDEFGFPGLGRQAPEGAAADPGQELLETVRRLQRQVTMLTEAAKRNARDNERGNRRRRDPAEAEEGLGDDEASEDPGRRNRRHGIRADSLKDFKFDVTDYHLWQFTMTRYLRILKLWGYVNGDIPRPDENEDEEDILNWDESNTEAEGVIASAVSKGQLQLITQCRSAQEMWDKLKETYKNESKTNQLRLLEQYHGATMKKGTAIEAHIKYMDSLVDKLRGVGELVVENIILIPSFRNVSIIYRVEIFIDSINIIAKSIFIDNSGKVCSCCSISISIPRGESMCLDGDMSSRMSEDIRG